MKKHYATHVEDTDKLISVTGPILEYETWYEQYKKLMEEQAQRKYGLYTPTSEGGGDFDPSSFDQAWTVTGKTNEDSNRDIIANVTGNGNDLKLTNFGFAGGSGYGLYAENYNKWFQVSARGDFIATADKINITAVKETTSTLIYKRGEHLKQRIRVSGLPEGVNLVIGRQLHDFYIIAEDGTYNIDVIDTSGVDPHTKIIMHLTHYETLFPSDMKIDGEEITEPTYPFPVYTSPSLEFSNLLASEEWSSNEEEYDI